MENGTITLIGATTENPYFEVISALVSRSQIFQLKPLMENEILQILKNATPYLSPQGILIVEVGNSESALIEKFPHIPFTWIEFQRGEDGVFLLTHKELMRYFG